LKTVDNIDDNDLMDDQSPSPNSSTFRAAVGTLAGRAWSTLAHRARLCRLCASRYAAGMAIDRKNSIACGTRSAG
jgi:hypothetical protein